MTILYANGSFTQAGRGIHHPLPIFAADDLGVFAAAL